MKIKAMRAPIVPAKCNIHLKFVVKSYFFSGKSTVSVFLMYSKVSEACVIY